MAGRRVVQWSTGGVGAIALRVLAERPDLELAGVWVHDAKKVGRDAGELAGLHPLGLAATSDRAALLALRPDCICYTASGESRPKECIEDLCEMLSAGMNVARINCAHDDETVWASMVANVRKASSEAAV